MEPGAWRPARAAFPRPARDAGARADRAARPPPRAAGRRRRPAAGCRRQLRRAVWHSALAGAARRAGRRAVGRNDLDHGSVGGDHGGGRIRHREPRDQGAPSSGGVCRAGDAMSAETAFSIVNATALLAWLALVLLPGRRWVNQLAVTIVAALFAAAYI